MKKIFVGAVTVGVGAPLVALGVSVSQAAQASAKPDGVGPCSSQCGVGGFHLQDPVEPVTDGRGYTSSGGNARGFLYRGPDALFGGDFNVFSAGTADSGRLVFSDGLEGTSTGHTHSDGSQSGRTTGALGSCTGRNC